jgi:hypothetical protein
MKMNVLSVVQAVCLCLIAAFFATELIGVTNSGLTGGATWCRNIGDYHCRRTMTVACPGNDACKVEVKQCEGTSADAGLCGYIELNACRNANPNCNDGVHSCACSDEKTEESDGDGTDSPDVPNDGKP